MEPLFQRTLLIALLGPLGLGPVKRHNVMAARTCWGEGSLPHGRQEEERATGMGSWTRYAEGPISCTFGCESSL